MDSIFRKPPMTRRTGVARSGSTAIDGGQIKIDLPLDFLVAEHRVFVEVSQAFSVLPTLTDVRRMFSKVELTSNQGTHYTGDFYQVYDASRFTERSTTPVIAVGASPCTAKFNFEIHHINDASKLDLLTALKTNKLSSLQLVLTLNADNANLFLNGTNSAAAEVRAYVQGREYPTLTNDPNLGIAQHLFAHLAERKGVAAADSFDVNLKAGGKIRHLFVHTFDMATGLPADGVLDKFNLSIGGVERIKNESFADLQQDNEAIRGLKVAGLSVIDFGDDPSQWPEITGDMGEVKLEFTSLATAPASWKARVAQDWTVGLDRLGVQ
ncbi:MAG TPA: hypothetical protein VK149_12550 [Sideroxyarcus sp.]|nr:hypothetical protein [Sideroxyarcus sp.]